MGGGGARGGGPCGAVIARDGEIIARGANSVTKLNDQAANAEVTERGEECGNEKNFKLEGCELYTSCEPCPMCLSAAYWAGIERIYYGNTREDAAKIGFDDSFIYDQIGLDPADRDIPAVELSRNEAIEGFRAWEAKEDKVEY